MNNAFIICRHKRRGNSSWMLEQALNEQGIDTYRVTPHRLPLRSRAWSPVFINYGCSQRPIWWDSVPTMRKIYNTFNTVYLSASKARMQQAFIDEAVPCLESTRSYDLAEQWASDGVVVCRRLDRSHSGRGIVLAHSPDEMVDASVYTKLFSGHGVREYRVYVVDGVAVDLTEKRRRGRKWCREHGVDRDSEESNVIRSWRNGWVFARNTMEATKEECRQIADVAEIGAAAIGLGLGAVDIIVRRSPVTGELSDIRVVETNTSIGLDGDSTTTSILATALANSIRSIDNATL